MSVPFGPQLIGQTEKALNALLRRFLDGSDVSEPQWVTLRLAGQLDAADAVELASAVADRAFFDDAAELVAALTRRGLLIGGRPSEAGRELMARVQAKIDSGEQTPSIWDDLDAGDVAATSRVLNEVLERARQNLGSLSSQL